MGNNQQAIKFNCIQVSELLDVLEKFGVDTDIGSDAHASAMLSELVVKAAKSLDSEQVDCLFNAI